MSAFVREATSGESVEAAARAAQQRAEAEVVMPIGDDVALWPASPHSHRVLEKHLSIRDRRDDFRAASNRVSEELREAQALLDTAVARKRKLLSDSHHMGTVDEKHSGFLQADRQIREVTATIARLSERHNHLSAASQSVGRLFRRCDDYLKANYFDLKLFDGDVPQIRNGESALDAHERTARRVRSLREDRKEILAAPYPSVVTKKLAREQLALRAEAAKPDVAELVTCCDKIEFPFVEASISNFAATSIVKANDPVGLLAWMFPKEFAAALDREIDAESDDSKALSNEQRITKLAEIDGDILTAEREEVHFIELAGLLPREDMDPRAVLGLADDMPATKK
ncbi:hypothetical protein ACVIW2_005061 [Bradyrhizobium huanghuaihaiense]